MSDLLRVYQDGDDKFYTVEYNGHKFALTEGVRADYDYDEYAYRGFYRTPQLVDMRLSLRCREIPPPPPPKPKRTRARAYGLRRPA